MVLNFNPFKFGNIKLDKPLGYLSRSAKATRMGFHLRILLANGTFLLTYLYFNS